MKTYEFGTRRTIKRVVFGRAPDPDKTAAEYGFLSPAHMLATFDYTLTPGVLPCVSIAHLREQLHDDNIQPTGLWLIRVDDEAGPDEYGWVCIHWPTYMKHVIWNRDTFSYLRNHGSSVRGLQKMALQDFEEAQDVIDSYKAVLLRALPPGCFLEAHNSFSRQVAEILIPPARLYEYDDFPLETLLQPWTIFRFSGLSTGLGYKYADRLSRWLQPYSCLKDQLISKALEEAPVGTPTLVMTLLTALKKARYSDGKGWQKWGIAWTRAGLAFNYRQAVNTIREDGDLYNSLFKGVTSDPCADWLDPAYLLQKPPSRLPRLGTIARNDARARNYIFSATAPYYRLFQDDDLDIVARKHIHGSDFQILFPINASTAFTHGILSYIAQLAHYRESTSPYAGKPTTAELISLQAPGSVEATRARKKEIKEQQELARLTAKYAKREKKITQAAKARVLPKEPTRTRDRTVYVAGFNGYNLGCTLPAPTDLPVYPFNMPMVEYKGDNYFGLPENLYKAFPELADGQFYDKEVTNASLVWHETISEGWQPKVFTPKHTGPSTYRTDHFAEISLTHFDVKRKPLIHYAERKVYLHHSVFRPDGEFNAIASGILEHRPELDPDHVNLLTTFQTLWQWVYELPSVIAQGKVSEEFMYTVGRDTTHCPPNRLLNSQTKRLQYIIDKASHSRDEHVCHIEKSSNRKAPRSKDMNTYDDFAMWYSAQHEIAELPWKLNPLQQAEYICKRWLPWRRPPGLVAHLHKPHKVGDKDFAETNMPDLLVYAKKTFGPSFTEY